MTNQSKGSTPAKKVAKNSENKITSKKLAAEKLAAKKVAEAEAKKVAAEKLAAEKVAEAEAKKAAKVEAAKLESERLEKLAAINTELFFIEDGDFFKELGEKISDKRNIDDFSFVDSAQLPGKVKIRQRNCAWEIKTTSKRGNIKGIEGSYLLIDPSGNKLKVSESMFQNLHNKLFGE